VLRDCRGFDQGPRAATVLASVVLPAASRTEQAPAPDGPVADLIAMLREAEQAKAGLYATF
jgi:hypothetical protein